MSKVHNIHDLQVAKHVVSDMPKILSILSDAQVKLSMYMQYQEVANITSDINQTKYMLDKYYKSYLNIVKKKGLVE